MLIRRHHIGIVAILLFSCLLMQLTPAYAATSVSTPTDWQQIATAKEALTATRTLNPVENVDTNVVPMAQALVDQVSSGVIVTLSRSNNKQVSRSGAITYGSTAKTGSVTYLLTKNRASNYQVMKIVVPAHVAQNQDQAAPTGLAGVAPTSTANNDGKITGVTTAMEYKLSTAATYTAATGTVITGLAAGTYQVRYAAKTGYNAGTYANVVVPAFVVKNVVNVKDYGAKGDGVSDDATAIQNAANAAKINRYTLYIPSGDYYLGKSIYIYTSVNSEGRFVIKNSASTPFITIARSVTGVNIPASSLSGLTRGSSKITGLNGYAGGTVVLKSKEELIKRNDSGSISSYTKNDASAITSTDGGISPALDCSYADKSLLTVTAYPKEDPITISGLSVKLIGDTANYTYTLWCRRTNVTFDNISLINTSSLGSPTGGMMVVDCDNTTINNPIISGYQGSGDKYGICLSVNADTIINGGTITNSRHGITGRHSKNVIVRNGYYAGTVSGVDSHWGNNFLVENCTIDGVGGISYAGTDITVRNCKFLNCINIFTLRNDTPEIMGKVVIENVTAKSPSNYNTIYCYRATYGGIVFDYGHKLAVPTIKIDGVLADIPSNGYLIYEEILSAYKADYTGKISFSNIQTLSASGTVIKA